MASFKNISAPAFKNTSAPACRSCTVEGRKCWRCWSTNIEWCKRFFLGWEDLRAEQTGGLVCDKVLNSSVLRCKHDGVSWLHGALSCLGWRVSSGRAVEMQIWAVASVASVPGWFVMHIKFSWNSAGDSTTEHCCVNSYGLTIVMHGELADVRYCESGYTSDQLIQYRNYNKVNIYNKFTSNTTYHKWWTLLII